MRRTEWIVGSILGFVVVGAIAGLLIYWLNSQPYEELDINNIENLTALEAYDLAQPLAQAWSGDAALLTARAGWQPQVDFTDGRASWNFVFYSAGKRATAMITVADNKAQLVRTSLTTSRVQTGDLSGWQVDSPAAINQLLQLGAWDFMTLHADINLILTLDNQGTPTWRSTFLDTGTKEAYSLNITADTGAFTP